MMRYGEVALCEEDQRKRTHVAARPVTPEPTTATRIVPHDDSREVLRYDVAI